MLTQELNDDNETIATPDKAQEIGKDSRDFGTLLEQHEPQRLHQGEIVSGKVIKLEENLAILDVGAKRDAIVPPQEMEEVGEGFLEELDVGDTVPAYVTRTPLGDEELHVSLVKGQRAQDWNKAEDYQDEDSLLELEITGYNKGGLLVAFNRLEGFVPNSHVPALKHIRDNQQRNEKKSEMVGSTLPVKVLEIERKHKRLIMSATVVEELLQDEQFDELEEGDTVQGRVVNIVDYGAFIDLGAITGLLHVSELAWRHVEHPSEVLEAGDEIELLVVDVDPERRRVGLSRKQLMPDPWERFAEQYDEGDLIEGEVTALVDFGAFVRLPTGVEGLIHVSEMHLASSSTPDEMLQPGEPVIVRITNIDPEEQRVGLSMRRVSEGEEIEWLSARRQSDAQDQDQSLEESGNSVEQQEKA